MSDVDVRASKIGWYAKEGTLMPLQQVFMTILIQAPYLHPHARPPPAAAPTTAGSSVDSRYNGPLFHLARFRLLRFRSTANAGLSEFVAPAVTSAIRSVVIEYKFSAGAGQCTKHGKPREWLTRI